MFFSQIVKNWYKLCNCVNFFFQFYAQNYALLVKIINIFTELKNKEFFIIDVQSMYELPTEKGYLPCEFACVKFSLQNGIIDTYHTFVNPGWLKLHK